MTGPLQERLQNGPEISDPTYGLGLMVGGYRGRKHISHGGGIDGFISAMEWLPDEQIGVIALSNTSHTGTVPALVVRNAFDRMLGLEPIDWAARARKREAEAKAKVEEAKKADFAAAVADTSPSHPLADYAGGYEHTGYGKASVRVHGDGLILKVVGIEFPLEALPLRPVHRPLRSAGQRGRGRIRGSQGPLRLRRRGSDQRRFGAAGTGHLADPLRAGQRLTSGTHTMQGRD